MTDTLEPLDNDSAAQADRAALRAGISSRNSYHVLKQTPDGNWQELARPPARDAKDAIRQTVNDEAATDAGGTYVAIPARSFQPLTITTRIVNRVEIEGL